MNEDKNVHIANYSSCELKHMVGVLVLSLRSVVFHKMTRVKKRVRLWPFTGSEKNKNPASGSASGSASASSDLQLQPLT